MSLLFTSCSSSEDIVKTPPAMTTHSEKLDERPDNSTSENVKKLDAAAKRCLCPQLWMPVCGDNGKTYSNACFADCASQKYSMGSCEKKLDVD